MTPVQITFRGMEPSQAIEQRVRDRTAQLERFCDQIRSVHVVVQAPHQHHHQGQLYETRILVHLPGEELVVNREGSRDHAHEDVYVAVRDAFDAAQRRIEDFVRRRDHRNKVHEVPVHGRVARLMPQDGYGFLETSDGLEVYFHENSVVEGRFADLTVGDEVRIELADRESDKGPQATTVRPMVHHHLLP